MMATLDELNKSVGQLEGKTNMLIHNQDRLIESVKELGKLLKRRGWFDSAKIVGGAFCGGFSAVIMKCAIWK